MKRTSDESLDTGQGRPPEPERSLTQRHAALERANAVRTTRMQLKRDLASGRCAIRSVLLDPPDCVETAKVFDMLLAVPTYGRVQATKVLTRCRISPSKTIGGLSERQRDDLIRVLPAAVRSEPSAPTVLGGSEPASTPEQDELTLALDVILEDARQVGRLAGHTARQSGQQLDASAPRPNRVGLRAELRLMLDEAGQPTVGGAPTDEPCQMTTRTPLEAHRRDRMPITVIVAEDFTIAREGVVRALNADPDIEVVGQADNGRDALRLAEDLEPDVMILDLRMPGLGGLAVIDELRTSRPQIRIVVMTASEQASTMLDAIAAGAAGYLSKRSTGEELRQAVITAHGGGSVVTPSLANLLKEFANSARGEQSEVGPLQGRELDVLRLVVQGKTDKEIAKELFISQRTVQYHRTRIRKQTGLWRPLRARPEEPG